MKFVSLHKSNPSLNSLASALQVFSLLTDLKTGNPDAWVNWFGSQGEIGKIYKDNEKEVYFQITGKIETKNGAGKVVFAKVTYTVFADYIWDEDENMYMGVQKLGTYTEDINVIELKTINRSFSAS